VLRRWFGRWGRPDQLRLDNGAPWGGWSDLPPDLALWLLGLDIDLLWNRPRHSQGNAVIERAHGVCQRWVEPTACPNREALQARLDWATTIQRERYPAVAGQSRWAAYPALATGGRPNDPDQEAALWQEQRVWRWLAARVWTRRVDKVGRISLANRPLAVGRTWARQEVTVRLEVTADGPQWVIHDAQGQRLRQHPAPELGRERIRTLDVTRKRQPRRGKPSALHPA
jgi:hypothetical protein